jgi:hypothetical protein
MIATVVVFDYALSLNAHYFRYNAYDVISRQLYRAIADDSRSHGLTKVRVGGTWWYQPEIDFYRCRYRAEWLLPYDVKDYTHHWEGLSPLPPAEYNYFVFIPEIDPHLSGPHVRTIFRDIDTDLTAIAIDK